MLLVRNSLSMLVRGGDRHIEPFMVYLSRISERDLLLNLRFPVGRNCLRLLSRYFNRRLDDLDREVYNFSLSMLSPRIVLDNHFQDVFNFEGGARDTSRKAFQGRDQINLNFVLVLLNELVLVRDLDFDCLFLELLCWAGIVIELNFEDIGCAIGKMLLRGAFVLPVQLCFVVLHLLTALGVVTFHVHFDLLADVELALVQTECSLAGTSAYAEEAAYSLCLNLERLRDGLALKDRAVDVDVFWVCRAII